MLKNKLSVLCCEMPDARYSATLVPPHGKETSISYPASRNLHRVRPRETDKLFSYSSLTHVSFSQLQPVIRVFDMEQLPIAANRKAPER